MGEDLVQAALRAAAALGKDVADVPIIAIAREAGVSRSTLLRRLGGSRAALDEAVRAVGVDPGGQAPVRARALEAAAELISESGLAAATSEAIAARARCSTQSLYAVFGGRDELLRAVFESYSPMLDIEDLFEATPGDLRATVRQFYGVLARDLDREPRVTPALFAEAMARPDGQAVQNLLGHNSPRLLAVVGAWLDGEVRAGRIRELPPLLLVQQLMSPVLIHMLLRPAVTQVPGVELPDIEAVCDVFADAFLRAVTTSTT
ncbi:TetR/AcrR family transcriptional regulator [Segniliparus rugosus]|uniref:TetR/AcrR family transcriptional regulator n=1 Tax=Segniliparus rugosus TaxID=286804 RepID=UPI00058DC0CE|nr:TetR/AcrR family transcriptional regulator [Segniliparus rugosus]